MKTLALLSLSLAVALGRPPFAPDVEQNPVFTEVEQSPLLGDWVPVQGHVVVEDPAPQTSSLSFKEQQEKMAPVDIKQSQSMVEPEVKVKSEVTKERELKPDVEPEPKVEVEQAGVVGLEVKVKPDAKVEEGFQAEQEVRAEPEVRVGQEERVELEVQVKPEVHVEPEVNMKPEVRVAEFKVASEVKLDPDVVMEPEPEKEPWFKELEEKFQVKMHLEPETDPGLVIEGSHADMEGKSEMMGEPMMALEPLDDDSMFWEEESDKELSEVEKSMRSAFQNQHTVAELLPEEEKGLMRKSDYVLSYEPIMELNPETMEDLLQYQDVMPDAAILAEGPELDMMGQQMSLSENFPSEEARMGVKLENQEKSLTVDGPDYLMMGEAETGFIKEEESPEQLFDKPAMEDHPVLDGGAEIGEMSERERRTAIMMMREGDRNPAGRGLLPKQDNQGQGCRPGVALEGKCYQFFRGPQRPADAEFFCQEKFPGGHLASITSQYIHREVMSLMLKQNGAYTRTWIGGLRFLDTGRFIWLDGSRWDYADWLLGEPNDTANVEDCVEVLGNGKFNDFTCWEPQAFICSYPH